MAAAGAHADANGSDLKYALYECSAIGADAVVAFFDHAFPELRGRKALSLREDFCGTFVISREWVASDPGRRAVALDIDPEPLSYGQRHHLPALSMSARRRLRPLLQNALSRTRPAVDAVVSDNYSFFALKSWDLLVRYLGHVRASLAEDGIAALAIAGGGGFTERRKDRRRRKAPGIGRFVYTWDQKSFDPISAEGSFAIHLRLPDGTRLKDAFVYDWRVWTIPEVRRAMEEAGFAGSAVYWEQSDQAGNGTNVYRRQERGDNDWCYNAYVVGLK